MTIDHPKNLLNLTLVRGPVAVRSLRLRTGNQSWRSKADGCLTNPMDDLLHLATSNPTSHCVASTVALLRHSFMRYSLKHYQDLFLPLHVNLSAHTHPRFST